MTGAATGPLIRTVDLTKNYRVGPETVHALAGLSVDIEEGEFVAIMGPSGSGKSTFMNLLGCLDTPTSGHYELAGERVSEHTTDQLAKTRNRKVGFVFQQFNLLPRVSALDNVAMPLMYGRVPRVERHQLAREALKAVGLGDRMGYHPQQLSGGQQQRVAIARALVSQPAMVLADEPTGALDTRTGIEIMALFQTLNKQGITLIIITHEAEVAKYAERHILFRDGQLISDERVADQGDAAADLAALHTRQEAAQ